MKVLSFFKLKFILIVLLASALFVSAVQIVLMRHKNRLLFIELQKIQQQRDLLDVSYGQLQLKQSVLIQHNRIETIARQELDMIVPNTKNIIIIKP